MFFIAVIVLLVLYQGQAHQASSGELWFMISIFAGAAYVGGFLDSRIFARLDKKRANLPADAEERATADLVNTSSNLLEQPPRDPMSVG